MQRNQISDSDALLFWSKAILDLSTGCLEWQCKKTTTGYGNFYLKTMQRYKKAHRVAWTISFGEIPEGMFVCHKCDNPLCVQPDHLFLGTPQDNHADMISKGRGSKPPYMAGHNRIHFPNEIIEYLGTMSDTDVARKFGFTKYKIAKERNNRNIPAFPCQTMFQKGSAHPRWSKERSNPRAKN